MSASVRSYVQAPALLCAAEITLIIPKWWRLFGPWFIRRYIAVCLWLKSKERKQNG